ncbi:MAG: DUF3847 domain-containing protein [Lachnospiraceae bacterium]|nr:DUF3847 domain-containing protein [Lachnospiraceae bacterium]
MRKTSADHKKKIEDVQLKITQLEHHQQILENRVRYLKQKDRKQRAHRLITRGAAVESIVPQVAPMPETEFYGMMEQVLMLPEVQRIIRTETAKYKMEGDAA